MVSLGVLLLLVGVVVYGAAKLRDSEGKRIARPDEVERAIEAADDGR